MSEENVRSVVIEVPSMPVGIATGCQIATKLAGEDGRPAAAPNRSFASPHGSSHRRAFNGSARGTRTLLASRVLARNMQEDLMDIICCPLDKNDLELDVDDREDDEILSGTLTCTECGETYPVEDGIPNLLPPDMRDEAAA